MMRLYHPSGGGVNDLVTNQARGRGSSDTSASGRPSDPVGIMGTRAHPTPTIAVGTREPLRALVSGPINGLQLRADAHCL